MTVLRDAIARGGPLWLADGYPESPSIGHRIRFVIGRFVDVAISAALQGSLAAVGRGTPTALKYIGAARGITRGRLDTDDTFAAKLPTWIQRWKEAGSQRRLAREIWEYLGDARVRVINRAGRWVTIETDGTMTETDATFDWDSVSNPERSGFWSDLFVVVYPTWAFRTGTLGDLTGDDGTGIGILAPHSEVDAVKALVLQWKAAHSCVRAIIWTSSTSRFDPTMPLSCPNGNWGQWSVIVGGHSVPSDRDLTECRYSEPR